MAGTNERVMDFVRRELAKDPALGSEVLFQRAKKVDPALSRLTVRQFHARYPLQVKRLEKFAARRGARRAAPAAADAPRRRGRPPGSRNKTTGRGPGRPRKNAAPAAQPVAARARRSAMTEPAGREGVRTLLLQFARDVAAAEGKADVVEVLTNVDRWVDRVIGAAG
jgi:hypothetical protein